MTSPRPLADRVRPATLAEVVGQAHLLGPGAPLGRMVAAGSVTSIILWGPPGTGKTTIARLLAQQSGRHFVAISAIQSGVAELRRVFEDARKARAAGTGTLLFCDEIHRFNRAQQDGFLPVVEDGTVVLVGATTENPSFELNGALLSRCQVLVLKKLDEGALAQLLIRAEAEEGRAMPLLPEAREAMIDLAGGDGRYLLNMAELIFSAGEDAPLGLDAMGQLLQRRMPTHDKAGDGHYDLLSCFHKALRGSDVQAALYYAARMMVAGEAGETVFRRLACAAAEDVGMATRRQCRRSSRPGTPTCGSAGPRASCSWRRPSPTSRPRRNPTPPTWASLPRWRRPNAPRTCRRHYPSSTHRRG